MIYCHLNERQGIVISNYDQRYPSNYRHSIKVLGDSKMGVRQALQHHIFRPSKLVDAS